MPTLAATEPVDYAVLGAAGAAALAGLTACLYTVPWRSCRAAPPSAPKATRSFNVLWHGRTMLALLLTAWALSPLLRVSRLWGANSLVFSDGVTSWTGSGWMCRIYQTVALGVLQPLCAFLALLMLTAGLSRRHRPEVLRHPNARLLGLAALCTLPVAAVQAVVAWLSLAVQYQGQPLERSPRSVLGYFFATYWEGSPEQCGADTLVPAAAVPAAGSNGAVLQAPDGSSVLSLSALDGGSTDEAAAAAAGGCTLCCFPAAAVIAHALFTLAFLAALWVTCSRLADAVLNTQLKRRMRLFQIAHTLLAVGGVAALGVSIVQGPFTWLNQACWAAYVGTVVATVALVLWEVVVAPVRDLRSVDKRLAMWADATTAAFAAAGADDPAISTQSSGQSTALIKAHNRSAEAEAYVQAAAAARALSVSPAHQAQQAQLAQLRPSLQLAPLALPPLPQGTPRRSPGKQPTPQRAKQGQPSPLRLQYGAAPPAPSLLVLPPHQPRPVVPPLPLSPLPIMSPQQRLQQQQQLYPCPSPHFVQRQQLAPGSTASLPPQQLFP